MPLTKYPGQIDDFPTPAPGEHEDVSGPEYHEFEHERLRACIVALETYGTGGEGGAGAPGAVNITVGDGVSAVSTGEPFQDIVFPFACTLTGVTLLADQEGSIVFDLRKCTYADFEPDTHPVSGDSICASAKPTLSSAAKGQDSTLSGWSKSLDAGDIVRVVVASASTLTRATLSLQYTKA